MITNNIFETLLPIAIKPIGEITRIFIFMLSNKYFYLHLFFLVLKTFHIQHHRKQSKESIVRFSGKKEFQKINWKKKKKNEKKMK